MTLLEHKSYPFFQEAFLRFSLFGVISEANGDCWGLTEMSHEFASVQVSGQLCGHCCPAAAPSAAAVTPEHGLAELCSHALPSLKEPPLGCGFDPWSGHVWETTDQCFSLTLISVCLSVKKKKKNHQTQLLFIHR